MKGILPKMEGKINLISWKNQSDGQEAFQGQARPPSQAKQTLLCNSPTSSDRPLYSKVTIFSLYMGVWSEGRGGKPFVWAYLHVPVSVQARFPVLTPTAQRCPLPPSHHPVTATSGVINGRACSSSRMNAISKTNKNLLPGNLQIKVHFPLKEARSHVCVEREFRGFTGKEARDVTP